MAGSLSRSFRYRSCAAVAAAGLVLALAGCSDDDPKPGTDEGPSTSPSAASSEATPTEDPSPTAAAATGVLLKKQHATINAPEGWQKLPDLLEFATEANPPTGKGAVRLTQLEFPGGEVPIDQQAEAALQSRLGDMKREADVDLDGVTFWHISGTPRKTDSHLDAYGVITDGFQTTLDFEFENSVPEAERQQIIDESLATFAWR